MTVFLESDRILVTGGTGFIGNYVIRNIMHHNCQILNLDFSPPRNPSHVPFWHAIDITNKASLYEIISRFQPNYVIHLASDIDVSKHNISDFETTIHGTENVVDAVSHLTQLKRLIHISTQYVVKPGLQPTDETFFAPYTTYGAAKMEAEKLVRQARINDWLILRPTIIWGPNHPQFPDRIWKYINNRLYLHPSTRKPLLRTYGYVENTAEQILRFALADLTSTSSRVFYLGDKIMDYDAWVDAFSIALTGKPAHRIPIQLLHVLAMMGSTLSTIGLPAPITLDRYYRMTTSAPIDDLKKTLGIIGGPSIDFDTGVRNVVSWLYREFPDTYKPQVS